MSKHSRQAKKELVCAICNRGVRRASISVVTGAGTNWSFRVVEQMEILPKVASSPVCRHGLDETQPEPFIDARNPTKWLCPAALNETSPTTCRASSRTLPGKRKPRQRRIGKPNGGSFWRLSLLRTLRSRALRSVADGRFWVRSFGDKAS